jgi:hypothetical protein
MTTPVAPQIFSDGQDTSLNKGGFTHEELLVIGYKKCLDANRGTSYTLINQLL